MILLRPVGSFKMGLPAAYVEFAGICSHSQLLGSLPQYQAVECLSIVLPFFIRLNTWPEASKTQKHKSGLD